VRWNLFLGVILECGNRSNMGMDIVTLTPKGPRPFFGPFLKFGHAIVDAIFVQKISNFW
jgi:hypothetical protein